MLEDLGLDDFSDDNNQENDEYLPENRRFLERMEDERLSKELSGKFISTILQTFMYNSMNVFLCLYLLNLGLGIFISAFAGFSVGCVPGVKVISENSSFKISGDERTMWINGKVLTGFICFCTSLFLSVNAVSEQNFLNEIAKKSQEGQLAQIERYERDGRSGIDPRLLYNILVFGGATLGGALVVGMMKRRFDDF